MFNVKFADIGEGIHEGVILKIFVKQGQEIEEGQDLFTLETDKVNAEIPSPVSGKILEIKYEVGADVNVGDTIIVVDDGQPGTRSNMEMEGEPGQPHHDMPKSEGEVNEPISEAKGASVVGQIDVSSDMIPSSDEVGGFSQEASTYKRVLATPVARAMAKDLGVDIKEIKGTGPNGRIMKDDIRKFAENQKAGSKSEPGQSNHIQRPKIKIEEGDMPVERVKMSMLRKTISDNMVKSRFTIPHTTVMDEADVADLVALKREVAPMASEEGVKLTYMAFFVRAVVVALKAYPYLNASLDETTNEIVLKKAFHIGLAVDTPEGLMVPVIRNADQKSIFEIAREIERLSKGAHDRTLKLEELKDSTFSITNYGSVGASFGVPIIRYPEAGILGIGAITQKPVVFEGAVAIREMMPLSLSFDHRVIDGADAGRFVNEVKRLLGNPHKLILK